METLLLILVVCILCLAILLGIARLLEEERIVSYLISFQNKKRNPFHPDWICYGRVALAFIGLIFYALSQYKLGVALYIIASFGDALDGMIARASKLVSRRGEKLDPLCDKITYLLPISYFVAIGVLPFWQSTAFIFVELLGQTLVRRVAEKHNLSVAANLFGKIKATLTFAIFPYIFVLQSGSFLPDLTEQIMMVCLVLAICSAVFKIIPNRLYADILSLLNLLCGLGSVYFIWQEDLMLAVLISMLGQIFDLLDGRMAIKHGGTKAGPWLDDLADLVNFGLAPSFLILQTTNPELAGLAGAYLLAIFYRLLRFVLVDKKRPDYRPEIFFGLPSPAGAMIIWGIYLASIADMFKVVVVLLAVVLSVSTIHFVHFGRGIVRKIPKPSLIVFSVACLVYFSWLFKAKNQTQLGYFILSLVIVYIITGEITKRKESSNGKYQGLIG